MIKCVDTVSCLQLYVSISKFLKKMYVTNLSEESVFSWFSFYGTKNITK